MSAAHVRRGGGARPKPRQPSKVDVPRRIAKKLPVDQARANKLAGLVLGAFLLAIGFGGVVAPDIPSGLRRGGRRACDRGRS